MNSIFVLALCLTAVLAAPQFNDPNHYAQHAQSVQLARQGHNARLENFGGSNTQQVVLNDDLCGLCESSRSGSEVSHAIAHGEGTIYPSGVGGSSSSKTEFSSQSSNTDASGAIYIPVGGSESSSSHSESSSQTGNVGVTAVLGSIGGGSESYTHESKSISSSAPAVTQVVYTPSGSGSYSEHTEQISKTSSPVTQVLYAPSSSGSHSYQHQEEHIQSAASPVVQVYAPSGGSSESHHYSAKTVQSVPSTIVPVYAPSSGSQSFHQFDKTVVESNPVHTVPIYTSVYAPTASEHSLNERFSMESVPVAPVVTYTPSDSSSYLHRHHESQQSLPVSVFPASTGSFSHLDHHAHSSKQISTAPVAILPAYGGGGAHSVHTESRFAKIGSTPFTPIVHPVSGSSRSSSFHESHSSNQAAPSVVYHSVPLTSQRFTSQQSSSSGNFGGNTGFLTYAPTGSSVSHLSHDSLSSGQFGSNAQLSSRFGSGLGSSSGVASELDQYISESDRLARLQANNIQTSSGFKTSSVADFGGAKLTPVSTGSRSKSWETKSKWGSQSEYDQTGVTKSSGYLSTAEGEDEEVNGRVSSYRAATSTVEQDGKKSTYSVTS